MDSMRSLNTSLPTASVPPEQLLQAFRSAALSVTQLYKSAVQDQNSSRAAGYQDALEDLLKFMDQQNIGVQDGEGWRVRQWATERFDGTINPPAADSEEERSDSGHAQNTMPSVPQPALDTQMQQNQENFESNSVSTQTQPESTLKFAYPSDTQFRFTGRAETDDQSEVAPSSPPSAAERSSPPPPPSRIDTSNRVNRAVPKSSARQNTRPSTRPVNSTIGAKRKFPQPDLNFFDISNIGPRDGNDGGPGGAKRSRHI